MLLKHARMGQHDRIVKIFCACRTGFHTCLALYADAGDCPEILRETENLRGRKS